MRERKGYSLKRQRGLVPHLYNTTSREYQAGADRWWPARMDYADRASQAHRETPSRNGYFRGHVFVRNEPIGPVIHHTDAKGCVHYRIGVVA